MTGVLYAGALGQESGNAIDDVLRGAVNPSGKLVHTIAKNESDCNPDVVISSIALSLNYTDGNPIDYKYFDTYNITPRWEFGYGLSCATFNYSSQLVAEASNLRAGFATGDVGIGGREDLWNIVATLTTTVANTGNVRGSDAAHLYVSFPDAAGEPARQLRGFKKVSLDAGENADVKIELRRRDLSVLDVVGQNWSVVEGEYVFNVGASSRDFKACTSLTV